MHPLLVFLLTYTVRYGSVALTYAEKARAFLWSSWLAYWRSGPVVLAPTARYFLGNSSMDVNTVPVVPQGAVYLEEWIQDNVKKCVVRYAGEEIPRSWTESPFAKHPRTPWIWVGDRETEVDLTRTFAKFLVVGNRITSDLVNAFIRVNPNTKLIYIESGTFKELEFPGDGLIIEEYADRPVQDRRPVH